MLEFELPPFVLHAIQRGIDIASVARYLSRRCHLFREQKWNADICFLEKVAALVALLYDHALTIGDEIRLIWAAPRSFLKWTFLINHYISEACLIAIANGECTVFLCTVYRVAQS